MRLFALTALLLITGCPRSEPAPPLTGQAEPARIGLQTMVLKRQATGADWKLSDEFGSVVLLDVWATWCEPCADSLPMYQDLLKQYGARGLKVYGINVDADPKAVMPFLKNLKVDVPVLLDPGAVVSEGAHADGQLIHFSPGVNSASHASTPSAGTVSARSVITGCG